MTESLQKINNMLWSQDRELGQILLKTFMETRTLINPNLFEEGKTYRLWYPTEVADFTGVCILDLTAKYKTYHIHQGTNSRYVEFTSVSGLPITIGLYSILSIEPID